MLRVQAASPILSTHTHHDFSHSQARDPPAVVVKRVLPLPRRIRRAAFLQPRTASESFVLQSVPELDDSCIDLAPPAQEEQRPTPLDRHFSAVGLCWPCQPSEECLRRRAFVEEIRVIAGLRHPNIIALMGAAGGDGGEPLLVMELMPMGSLWDLLRNQTVLLEEVMVLGILRGVARGMAFLHAGRPPVIHCDLKTSNVLINEAFQAKVSDFSLSSLSRWPLAGPAAGRPARGTPFWMAPECLEGGPNSVEGDVFSFGITLFEVMARAEPYEGENGELVLQGVQDGWKRPQIPDGCSFKVCSVERGVERGCYFVMVGPHETLAKWIFPGPSPASSVLASRLGGGATWYIGVVPCRMMQDSAGHEHHDRVLVPKPSQAAGVPRAGAQVGGP
jgi:serine/threonine protein kinase